MSTQPKRAVSGSASSTRRHVLRASDTAEDVHKLAAHAIWDADFLLLAAGAGFSADSGLPVFADIANVPAYHKMKVTYCELCDPSWLKRDPEVFFGFWGHCLNTYRDIRPHEGYAILKRWTDTILKQARSSTSNNGLSPSPGGERPKSTGGRSSKNHDGGKLTNVVWSASEMSPFFVFTSNIDSAFRKSGFSENLIFEIHGNIDTWQCQSCCCEKVWNIDEEFRFEIDLTTMRCPPTKRVSNAATADVVPKNGESNNHKQEHNSDSVSHHVKKSQSLPEILSDSAPPDERLASSMSSLSLSSLDQTDSTTTASPRFPRFYFPQQSSGGEKKQIAGSQHPQQLKCSSSSSSSNKKVVSNRILCQLCKQPARPNILMFEDENWIATDAAEQRYNLWEKNMLTILKQNRDAKIVILEIGCGTRIPTVRKNSERLLLKCNSRADGGTQAKLIRINPDMPGIDGKRVSTQHVISIREKALEALCKIDEDLQTLLLLANSGVRKIEIC